MEPPYAMECFDALNCRNPGIEVEYLLIVSQLLGYQISFQKTSKYAETYDMLLNGSGDISATLKVLHPDIFQDYNILPCYIAIDWPVFITNKFTAVDIATFALVKIISPTTWLMIAIISGWFYLKFPLNSSRKALKNVLTSYQKSAKYAKALWFVFFVILMNTYASLLTIQIARPKFITFYEIKNVRDAIEALYSRKCELILADINMEYDLRYMVKTLKIREQLQLL